MALRDENPMIINYSYIKQKLKTKNLFILKLFN